MTHGPLEFLYARFTDYVEDRRAQPARRRAHRARDRDVPRRLAARGHRRRAGRGEPVRGRPGDDGAPPRRARSRCSASAPTSRTLLRAERDRIPNFVEEMLRFESPIKGDFRLSRVATTVGGVDIPAGTTVMVLNGAANRDPRRFEHADEFQVDRANARQHIAFGHGVHTCPGAPLARAEGCVSVERILDRMRDIEDLRDRARPRRRAPLRLRADVHPARPQAPPPGVHARQRVALATAALQSVM